MKNEENNFEFIKNMEKKYCNSPIIKKKLNQNKINKIDLFEEENNKNFFKKENIFFVNNNNNNNENKIFYPYLNYINKEKDFINNKNNNKTILKLLLINSIKI